MAKKTDESMNTEVILAKPATLEVKPCTYEELLREAKAAQGVTVQEIDPCQSVTVEAHGRAVEAFLVVKEV